MSVLIPPSTARDGRSWKIVPWSVQCEFTAVIGRKSSRDSSMTALRSLRGIGKLSAYFHPLSFSAYQFDTHRDEFNIPILLGCFSSENNHPMKDVLMPELTEPLKVWATIQEGGWGYQHRRFTEPRSAGVSRGGGKSLTHIIHLRGQQWQPVSPIVMFWAVGRLCILSSISPLHPAQKSIQRWQSRVFPRQLWHQFGLGLVGALSDVSSDGCNKRRHLFRSNKASSRHTLFPQWT